MKFEKIDVTKANVNPFQRIVRTGCSFLQRKKAK